MHTARLNIPCPRRILSGNAVYGGKEVVRNLVVSIPLSMVSPHDGRVVCYLKHVPGKEVKEQNLIGVIRYIFLHLTCLTTKDIHRSKGIPKQWGGAKCFKKMISQSQQTMIKMLPYMMSSQSQQSIIKMLPCVMSSQSQQSMIKILTYSSQSGAQPRPQIRITAQFFLI